MTALVLIGFAALCVAAAYMTLVAASCVLGEAFLGGVGAFSYVVCAIAGGLWALVWWLSPFTITVGVAA
jgi:hypothetical protein